VSSMRSRQTGQVGNSTKLAVGAGNGSNNDVEAEDVNGS
jgi:hypothetical protein